MPQMQSTPQASCGEHPTFLLMVGGEYGAPLTTVKEQIPEHLSCIWKEQNIKGVFIASDQIIR